MTSETSCRRGTCFCSGRHGCPLHSVCRPLKGKLFPVPILKSIVFSLHFRIFQKLFTKFHPVNTGLHYSCPLFKYSARYRFARSISYRGVFIVVPSLFRYITIRTESLHSSSGYSITYGHKKNHRRDITSAEVFIHKRVQNSRCATTYPTQQPELTPMSPGIMNEWFNIYLPMRVVPERSNPMHARSDGYVGRKK